MKSGSYLKLQKSCSSLWRTCSINAVLRFSSPRLRPEADTAAVWTDPYQRCLTQLTVSASTSSLLPSCRIQHCLSPSSVPSPADPMSSNSLRSNMSCDHDDSLTEEHDFCYDVIVEKKPVDVDRSEQRVFEEATLIAKVESVVKKTNSFLETTPINCRMLLYQFRWKDDVLIERFYDGKDVGTLLKASNVSPSPGTPLPETSGECELCCGASESVVRFSCDTQVCPGCFDDYLSGKMRENGVGFVICPGFDCSELIDDAAIVKYCSDKEGYRRLVLNSYVLANSQMKWCPGVGCNRVIEVGWTPRETFTRTVECDCGKKFCFNCYGERHEPVSCEILKRWNKKHQDDSETTNWILTNTKTCPKCRGSIEKDGGCIHMTCRQPGCGYEFCWICSEPWTDHSYNCRKYQQDTTGEKTEAEVEFRRFAFFDRLYSTHKKSIEFNEKLYAKVSTMREVIRNMDSSRSLLDLDFLNKSVDSLLKCRTTLMYTYPFAFFLKDNSQKAIFEDNQIDLEKAVEELNGYLEKENLECENLTKLRQNIVNLSAYLEKRRTALLEHVRQGEEHDFWSFL
uniref:RBR-type E3 ubiquitin transferase n=1 Tax=Steinernema glaseri TaxID=37863 RepID=A0A1I8AQX1_9BILA